MKVVVRFFAFLVFGCVCLAAYNWDDWLDHTGVAVTSRVTDKRETVRVHYADWYRRFEVVAAFRAPGSTLEHSTICDVDQQTFDAVRIGQAVNVHIWPGMLFQPFVPSSHLSICPKWAIFGFNSELYTRSLYIYGSLAIILVAGLLLRMRRALWLLLPWSAFFVFYGVCPHAEPAPLHPQVATAVVRHIHTVKTLMEDRYESAPPLQLTHPYQLVQLAFTPEGRTDPVLALDAIDLNSAPGAQEGRTIHIEYDTANPRVARIPGATRNFPQQAQRQIGLGYLVIVVLLAGLLLFAGSRGSQKPPRRRL